MKRYEYKAVTIPTSISMPITIKHYEKIAQEFEAQLNNLGADGWELVQRADGLFFFKREIE